MNILNKIDTFYAKGNNAINLSAVNNKNYKKSKEEILSEQTQELIYKILIKKGNKKETLKYSKLIKENGEFKNVNIIMSYFKLKTGNITSLYTDNLVDINLYGLIEFLNVFSETKFKYLNIDKNFYEKISILDIGKRFKFHDIIFIELEYFFLEKGKIITRKGILSENGDVLNIEGEYFINKLYGESDILGVKFLKAGDETGVYCFLDIYSKPFIINGKYIYKIEESRFKVKGKKYYEFNNGEIILNEDDLSKILSNYTSFDLSNIEIEEIYE